MDNSSLAAWEFNIEEVSAGLYKIRGQHKLGPTIESTGPDPGQLLQAARKAAAEIDQQLTEKQDR